VRFPRAPAAGIAFGESGATGLRAGHAARAPARAACLRRRVATARQGARSARGGRTWSDEWVKWRRPAEWPEDPNHSGLHALRHYFAIKLIEERVDPKDVRRALRHASLQLTLETQVHFWLHAEQQREIAGEALKPVAAGRR
jgi:integrase